MLASLAVLAGCHHVNLTDHRWVELRTEHFLVRTDLAEDDARRSAAEMETARSSLLDAFSWGGADQNRVPPFHVIELAEPDELAQLTGPNIGGFTTSDAFGEEMVVIAAGSKRSSLILRHELTHALAGSLLRSQPVWFAEGMAAFVESSYLENGEAIFGGLNIERSQRLRRRELIDAAGIMSVRNLLSVNGIVFEDEAYAIFVTLFNRYPRELANYMQSLARGDSREGLFESMFPGVSPTVLTQLIDAQFETDRGTTRRIPTDFPLAMRGTSIAVPLRPYAGSIEVRALSLASVHSELGDLYAAHVGVDTVQAASRAKAEYALALSLDPGDPSSLAFDFASETTPLSARITAARKAAQLHPDAFRAQLLLAIQLENEELRIWKEERRIPADIVAETRAELEQATAHAPDAFFVHAARSLFLAEHGSAAQALPIAQHMVALDPSNAAGPLIEAHVMTLLGQNARARELLQSAAEKTPKSTFRNFIAWSVLYQHDLERPISAKPDAPGDRPPMRVACASPSPDFRTVNAGPGSLDAQVRFAVDARGVVSNVERVKGEEAVVAAIRGWLPDCRFEPAKHEGKPVDGELELSFVFLGR